MISWNQLALDVLRAIDEHTAPVLILGLLTHTSAFAMMAAAEEGSSVADILKRHSDNAILARHSRELEDED